MRYLILIILLVGLYSCSNNNEVSKNKNNSNQDTSILTKYNNQLAHSNKIEKDFILKVINTIECFKNRDLDTTVFLNCFIDNDKIIDTIKTRVFDLHDTIIVHSTWMKNGCIQWEKKFKNPYLWISDNSLFEYNKRDKWVTFTIGIYNAIPKIYKLEDYKNLIKPSIEIGLNDLKENGFYIKKEAYKQYVLNFKGNIIIYGEPEDREGMFIWYEPLKRFVSFYHE